MTRTIITANGRTRSAGRPAMLPNAVRKTITLDEADVEYVEKNVGDNFSEAVRRLIETHREVHQLTKAANQV